MNFRPNLLYSPIPKVQQAALSEENLEEIMILPQARDALCELKETQCMT